MNVCGTLDAQLSDCVRQLGKLDEQHADMEQARERAGAAKSQLAAFAASWTWKRCSRPASDRQLWTESNRTAEAVAQSIRDAAEVVAAVDVPQMDGDAGRGTSVQGDTAVWMGAGPGSRLRFGMPNARRKHGALSPPPPSKS